MKVVNEIPNRNKKRSIVVNIVRKLIEENKGKGKFLVLEDSDIGVDIGVNDNKMYILYNIASRLRKEGINAIVREKQIFIELQTQIQTQKRK